MAAKKDTEEFEQLLVSSKVLEALFGVKDRTIRDLADKGIVKRDSHGKYLFWNSAKSYITALKVANVGRGNTKTKGVMKRDSFKDDDEASLDLEEEKAQHEHMRRQITEIKHSYAKEPGLSAA